MKTPAVPLVLFLALGLVCWSGALPGPARAQADATDPADQDPPPRIVPLDDWLRLGPVPAPLPAFHDDEEKGFGWYAHSQSVRHTSEVTVEAVAGHLHRPR